MKDLINSSIISIGDMIPEGRYDSLLNRYETVVNFLFGKLMITVGTSEMAPGPFRIVLKANDLKGLNTVVVTALELILNDEHHLVYTPLHIYRQLNTLSSIGGRGKDMIIREMFHILTHLDHETPITYVRDNFHKLDVFDEAMQESYLSCLSLLWKGDETGFAQRIKGRGIGSTPSGDDFLIGYLIGLSWLIEAWGASLHKQRDAVFHASLGSSPMVNAFLGQAYTFRLDKPWSDFLNSLARNRVNRIGHEFNVLRSMGATSGDDMLSGFLISYFWNRPCSNGVKLMEEMGIKKVI